MPSETKEHCYIGILGNWRTKDGRPIDSKKKNGDYGSKIRANTKKSNTAGYYGTWSVHAATDLQQAYNEVKSFKDYSLSNLVLVTEGRLQVSEKSGKRYYSDVGFAYNDEKTASFIETGTINKYLENPSDVESTTKKMIDALKSILRKVKTGGNVIITACQTGYSENQSRIGQNLGLALSKLSPHGVNYYLSKGLCTWGYDDPTKAGAIGLRINDSLNFEGPVKDTITGKLLPAGWLRYGSDRKTANFQKISITHFVFRPIAFE